MSLAEPGEIDQDPDCTVIATTDYSPPGFISDGYTGKLRQRRKTRRAAVTVL